MLDVYPHIKIQEALEVIPKLGFVLDIKGHPRFIDTTNFRRTTKCWSYIIETCLYPTKQHSKVGILRVALLYLNVAKTEYINVRHAIHDAMRQAMMFRKHDDLPLLILITQLCMRANVGFHEMQFNMLPQSTITDTTIKMMRAVKGYNDLEEERETNEIRRYILEDRTNKKRFHASTQEEVRKVMNLMIQAYVPVAGSSSTSTERARRKRFFKSLFSDFQRNKKKILRNYAMLEANERTLAHKHSMSEGKMESLRDHRRSIMTRVKRA
ncbi:hypothetical protein Syun_027970 [Stephania yunnanensis]|uniref:Putative plant transposon protein domain-containing protein n=1 Tax=Stephania yunnanensis TaxID=152371 RepID=A0AAP0HNB0_9MAGN